jgi:hypothetical protein
VDTVFSWNRKGFGSRYGRDLRAGAHTFVGARGPVPWFAYDWSEEYERLPPLERVMKSVAVLNQRYFDQLDRLTPRYGRRLLPLTFERIVRDPDGMVKALAEFLDTQPTALTPEVLRRQRVPRPLDRLEFKTRFDGIRKASSKATFELFVEDCLRYEKRFKPGLSIRKLS